MPFIFVICVRRIRLAKIKQRKLIQKGNKRALLAHYNIYRVMTVAMTVKKLICFLYFSQFVYATHWISWKFCPSKNLPDSFSRFSWILSHVKIKGIDPGEREEDNYINFIWQMTRRLPVAWLWIKVDVWTNPHSLYVFLVRSGPLDFLGGLVGHFVLSLKNIPEYYPPPLPPPEG